MTGNRSDISAVGYKDGTRELGTTVMAILLILLVILSITSIGLHCLGIHLLRSTPSIHPNEKIILINLSITEITHVFVSDSYQLFLLFSSTEMPVRYTRICVYVTGFAWVYIMVSLTLDRFLQVFLNIKYDIHVTQKKIKATMLASYVISVTLAMVFFVLEVQSGRGYKIVTLIVHPFHGAICLLTFALAYIYIYFKIRSNRRSSNQNPIRTRKGLFLPFWIVLTYLILIVLPGDEKFSFHFSLR